MKDHHLLYIISTHAGQGHGRYARKALSRFIDMTDVSNMVTIIDTEHENHAAELAKTFSDRYGEEVVVYACGGDGTINEVANALQGTETPMGVIPLGTANDLSKTLYGQQYRLLDLLGGSFFYELDYIDLIRINDIYCVNVMSVGFDAVVLENTYNVLEAVPSLGKHAYPFGILKSLAKRPIRKIAYNLQLMDGKIIQGEDDYLFIAVANGGYYGGGYNPSPNAQIDDGILEVCMVSDLKLLEIARLLPKYKKGTHYGHPAIQGHEVVSGSFNPLDGQNLIGNYDGVLFESESVHFEVVPKALRFARIPSFFYEKKTKTKDLKQQ